MAKPIALAADHGGFELKEAVKAHLKELGLEYIDFGTHSTDSVDYPDMAVPACDAVVSGECERGILCCGTGIGMSMTANHIPGIRAALCGCEFQARATRQHNNANMMAIGAGFTGPKLAAAMVETFLSTAFEGGRHARRVALMDAIEG